MKLWQFASLGLLLPLLGQAPAQSLTQAQKNSLLSRKKWYVSYSFSMTGSGGPPGNSWRVDMQTQGTIELNHVIPGQFPLSSTADDVQDTTPGRFIAWMAMPTDETNRRMEQGETNPARLEGMFYPFQRQVMSKTFADPREDTWQGVGVGYAVGPCQLYLDLKKGTYDLAFSVGPTDFGSGVRHTWRSPDDNGQDDAAPSHHTAWIPNDYAPQLFKRNLIKEMRPDGTISFGLLGTTSISHAAGNQTLSFGGRFTISPTPPSTAKLILKPQRDYATWRPKPGESETERGDFLRVDWRVEEQGRRPEVRRVIFRLGNVSKFPGVCMNWPLPPLSGSVPPKPKFDLAFPKLPPGTGDFMTVDEDQALHVSGKTAAAASGDVFVECFDGAAIGELIAEAELEDGRILQAEIEGQSGTKKLLIPDREEGVSEIARHWRDSKSVTLPDSDDSEEKPEGDLQQGSGDGLTIWEEYRGFRQGFEWKDNCNPKRRDLFIDNRLGDSIEGGLTLFSQATKLRVHEYLDESEHLPNRVINFNKRADRWVVDQHCIVMIRIAEGASYSQPIGPPHSGPPRNTEVVAISDTFPDRWDTYTFSADVEISYNGRNMAVAHELSHAIGVYHHGERDPTDENDNYGILWFWQFAGGVPQFLEGARPGKVIRVLKEPEMVPMGLSELFGEGETEKKAKVGMQHGEHSGDVECYMRYNNADYYEYLAAPMTRVHHGESEPEGNKLCTSAKGTYFNDSAFRPQSRYGDADAMRGDCLHQFVVNDKLTIKNRRRRSPPPLELFLR